MITLQKQLELERHRATVSSPSARVSPIHEMLLYLASICLPRGGTEYDIIRQVHHLDNPRYCSARRPSETSSYDKGGASECVVWWDREAEALPGATTDNC